MSCASPDREVRVAGGVADFGVRPENGALVTGFRFDGQRRLPGEVRGNGAEEVVVDEPGFALVDGDEEPALEGMVVGEGVEPDASLGPHPFAGVAGAGEGGADAVLAVLAVPVPDLDRGSPASGSAAHPRAPVGLAKKRKADEPKARKRSVYRYLRRSDE